MIAALFVQSTIVAALLGFAAALVEPALARSRAGSRWLWFLAAVVTPVLSLSPWISSYHRLLPSQLAAAAVPSLAPDLFGGIARPLLSAGAADRALAVVWAVGAAAVVASLACAVVMVRRMLRRPGRRLGPVRLIRSDRIGPGVVGLAGRTLLLPSWLRRLERRDASLVVLHELEHVRAADPVLASLSWVPLLVMPFNPALWWIRRRLAAAIELDCDARVLRRRPGARRRYADLLIQAQSRHRPALAVGFTSLLERRLAALTDSSPPSRVSRRRVAIAALVVLVAFASPDLTRLVCEASQMPAAESYRPTH